MSSYFMTLFSPKFNRPHWMKKVKKITYSKKSKKSHFFKLNLNCIRSLLFLRCFECVRLKIWFFAMKFSLMTNFNLWLPAAKIVSLWDYFGSLWTAKDQNIHFWSISIIQVTYLLSFFSTYYCTSKKYPPCVEVYPKAHVKYKG